MFKDILDQSGYQAFIAQNEEDVLSIISQEAVDPVYIDLEMPELNSSADLVYIDLEMPELNSSADLVYIDLEMPELNSSAISNQIKTVNPNTMVVLISGYPPAIAEDEIKSIIGGAVIDRFVDKSDLFNLSWFTEKLLSERPN
jgi:CheY-like chemotaxis protein